ncbi:hypothetical protein B0H13DRAFT_2226773 [Mycena leptocephala]|nr:hypothetical protein B0H13DRAFT_2226773 [Mycena leptocephala]
MRMVKLQKLFAHYICHKQAATPPLTSVAICQETLAAEGRYALYKRIFVSPEVAGSLDFRKKVLSQPGLQEHLRMLGVLRGRVPPSVVFIIASATLPKHVLDEVCAKLKIGKDAVTVWLSSARPNVALAVGKIVHPDETKTDLRFLIPENATTAADIPITLVYFNQRIETEDACDRLQSWATSSGMVRKRELETMLRDGHIRILCCTDAVGMGRYMRIIESVILWKLPPSFGALAQRSGRAARDFERLVEAILFVPAKLLKDGVAEEEARLARVEQFSSQGGARAEEGNEAEKAEAETAAAAAAKSKKKRKAARISFADALEAKFLSSRIIWDEYFQNATKGM